MKKTKFVFLMLLMSTLPFCIMNAQTVYPKGNAAIKEFTNATAKFVVPPGKTWYIVNCFSDCATDVQVSQKDPESYNYSEVRIFIKSINGLVLTDLEKKKFGTVVFRGPNHERVQPMPVVLPENTVIEFLITSGDWASTVEGSKVVKDDDLKAWLNYIETDN